MRDWNAVRFDPSGKRGHVESYFLKLNDPEGRRALWLKATILAAQGRPPVAETWAIAFDREGEHVAAKQVVPFEDASFSPDGFDVKVAGVHFERGRVAGAVESAGRQIEWALDFETDVAPLVQFPSLKMYETALPSSKFVTPYPSTRFSGHYHVDGKEVPVDGWRGMQGHNWGKNHAEKYAWGHCNQWLEGEDLMLEGVTARVKMGPVLVPPLTLLFVWHRGVRYEFNDTRSLLLSARGEMTHRSWAFSAKGPLAKLEGELHAETEDFVGLYYENPNGEMTYCLNSKIARGRIRLEVKGRAPLVLTTRSAALEIGTKDPRHGVRMLA
jgi:hypothetical protein